MTKGRPVTVEVLHNHIFKIHDAKVAYILLLARDEDRIIIEAPADLWHALSPGNTVSTDPSPGSIEYELWKEGHLVNPDKVVYFTRRLDVPISERHFTLCRSGVWSVFDHVPERLYLRRQK